MSRRPFVDARTGGKEAGQFPGLRLEWVEWGVAEIGSPFVQWVFAETRQAPWASGDDGPFADPRRSRSDRPRG